VERIDSYSGHADYGEIVSYLECQNKSKVRQIMLVHGDLDAQEFFAGKLKEAGFGNVVIPELGEEVLLHNGRAS
jgi:metallo-beta-lactamase family protein